MVADPLFRNLRAKPGIRVRLEGPSWNRDAVGATLRLKWGNQYGPIRAIQIGSGYWSQESLVQIMSAPVAPSAIWVRWPGGRVSETLLQPNQREITVTEKKLAN